jgi:hypothetical protein
VGLPIRDFRQVFIVSDDGFGHESINQSHLSLTANGLCCHLVIGMSVTIQLDLPEALVKEARANGLLESAPVAELLAAELRRRKAAAELSKVLDGIRAQPGEPMTVEEIQAEVEAVRAEKRAREARH